MRPVRPGSGATGSCAGSRSTSSTSTRSAAAPTRRTQGWVQLPPQVSRVRTAPLWTAEDDGVGHGRRARRRFAEARGLAAASACGGATASAAAPVRRWPPRSAPARHRRRDPATTAGRCAQRALRARRTRPRRGRTARRPALRDRRPRPWSAPAARPGHRRDRARARTRPGSARLRRRSWSAPCARSRSTGTSDGRASARSTSATRRPAARPPCPGCWPSTSSACRCWSPSTACSCARTTWPRRTRAAALAVRALLAAFHGRLAAEVYRAGRAHHPRQHPRPPLAGAVRRRPGQAAHGLPGHGRRPASPTVGEDADARRSGHPGLGRPDRTRQGPDLPAARLRRGPHGRAEDPAADLRRPGGGRRGRRVPRRTAGRWPPSSSPTRPPARTPSATTRSPSRRSAAPRSPTSPRPTRRARVVVLSSVVEGFPISLVEAMFCGRATVSTDVGAVVEVIGGTGLVVPPRNPRALAEACVALLRDPERRARLGAAARARALELFTVEQNVAAFRGIYLEIVSHAPVRRGPSWTTTAEPLPFAVPAEATCPGRWTEPQPAGRSADRGAARGGGGAAGDAGAADDSGAGRSVACWPSRSCAAGQPCLCACCVDRACRTGCDGGGGAMTGLGELDRPDAPGSPGAGDARSHGAGRRGRGRRRRRQRAARVWATYPPSWRGSAAGAGAGTDPGAGTGTGTGVGPRCRAQGVRSPWRRRPRQGADAPTPRAVRAGRRPAGDRRRSGGPRRHRPHRRPLPAPGRVLPRRGDVRARARATPDAPSPRPRRRARAPRRAPAWAAARPAARRRSARRPSSALRLTDGTTTPRRGRRGRPRRGARPARRPSAAARCAPPPPTRRGAAPRVDLLAARATPSSATGCCAPGRRTAAPTAPGRWPPLPCSPSPWPVAPAAWCARLFAVRARRKLDRQPRPGGVRRLRRARCCSATSPCSCAPSAALLALCADLAGRERRLRRRGRRPRRPALARPAAHRARLHPRPGRRPRRRLRRPRRPPCARSSPAACPAARSWPPPSTPSSRPGAPDAVPALACGAAALGLLVHATRALTRASAHALPPGPPEPRPCHASPHARRPPHRRTVRATSRGADTAGHLVTHGTTSEGEPHMITSRTGRPAAGRGGAR